MVFGLVAVGLTACGGNDTPAPAPPVVVPPPPAAKLEDGFGAVFGTTFRADANGEATDPSPGDIIPLDLTKEAVTI